MDMENSFICMLKTILMNSALSMWEISSMEFFMDKDGNWTAKASKLSVSSLMAERMGLEGSITQEEI
jgi:hypothetical protein